MTKRSGNSKGSRNSKKSEGSDRSKKKIDLDKDPDLNLDKPDDIELSDKESDSNFGELSKELGLWEDEESGQSVSLVAGVDVVPLGLNISANGDIGTVGVDIGLPGDVIGIGGNIQVNLETGDIIGGGGSIDYGGVSVGVDQIRKDGETCTTLTVTYFGVGVSYQRCKKDDEDDEKDPPKDPPPPPPDDDEIPPPPPIDQIPGDPNKTVFALMTYHSIFNWSYSDSKGKYYQGKMKGDGSASMLKGQGLYMISSVGFSSEWYRDEPEKNFTDTSFQAAYIGFYSEPFPGAGITPEWFWEGYDRNNGWYSITLGGTPNGGSAFLGKVADCNQWLKWQNDPQTINTSTAKQAGWARGSLAYYHIIETGEEGPEKPKKPNPPIPPEDDMSNCCDLEPVMSLLRKVSSAIGTDQLPANMPKSFLKNEGTRAISNLAELQVYQLEIMDQLVGKFPIELEIADTDPLTPGDQTKKVILTNLAESIAELFGLAINGASDNAIQTSGVIKNLLEITLVRQAVLQNYYRLDAILDYLGAGLEEDTTTFNSTISMPKDPNNISEDVADFLQQSEIKFAYDKLANPKDTLTAKLLPIQKAADIIKAKYWKGFGKAGGDYLGAIKSWLKTYDPKNEQNDTEWKDKIDKILEEYAKDATGNIDKDRMPVIQNVTQIGSEPKPPGA